MKKQSLFRSMIFKSMIHCIPVLLSSIETQSMQMASQNAGPVKTGDVELQNKSYVRASGMGGHSVSDPNEMSYLAIFCAILFCNCFKGRGCLGGAISAITCCTIFTVNPNEMNFNRRFNEFCKGFVLGTILFAGFGIGMGYWIGSAENIQIDNRY